jgi:hypothetical protein
MDENNPNGTKSTPPIPTEPSGRVPANVLVQKFIETHGISILLRRQQVRYLEDNGMVIEPPSITILYNDDLQPNPKKVQLPGKNN